MLYVKFTHILLKFKVPTNVVCGSFYTFLMSGAELCKAHFKLRCVSVPYRVSMISARMKEVLNR